MKITNENFFELESDTPDDEVNENTSATGQTAAERLRNKLMSLRMRDNGDIDPDAGASEVPVDNHEDNADDKTNVSDDDNAETEVSDDDKVVDKTNVSDDNDETEVPDEDDVDDKTEVPDDDNAETEVSDEDDVDDKANVPDEDDKVVDLQKEAPIVFPHDDDGEPIDMAPSKNDVPQQPADIATRYVNLPEELKDNYRDDDAFSELSTTNDEPEPEVDANDDEPEPEVDANDDELEAEADANDESDTNDDEPELDSNDEADANDESDADDNEPEDDSNDDEVDERIQLKQPDDKNHERPRSRKKILAFVSCVAITLIATTTAVGVSHMHNTSSQSRTASSSRTVASAKKKAASASSSSVDGSSLNVVNEKLTAAAKATGQPYNVQVTALGGGYTMGVITYYPNDATKTYMDYSITAPKKPGAVTDDKTAQDINKKLSSSLPTINKTITVADSSKVSMNTYKQSDGSYHTILLYDNKPFGFVTTKADGSMINNVTTYYIQTVQKKNN